MTQPPSPCQVCYNLNHNKMHTAREMMFGTREEFDYLECAHCGCVQLVNVPNDMAKYYPLDYYSFKEEEIKHFDPVRAFLRKQKHSYCLHGKNFIGKMLVERAGMPPHYSWLRGGHVNFASDILDVGCGVGHFLNLLREDGFTSLTGVDPFIKDDIHYKNGVTIWKKTLAQIDQQFDFVIMNHAFEHMAEPLSVLRDVQQVLKPGRYALIRIPVASSYAWRKYGIHWVQLDPPRHLFLHTLQSIKLLAESAGLRLSSVFYDSNTLQFTGSEKYLEGIALTDTSGDSLFSEQEILNFERQAHELNEGKQGDQAGFFLLKE